MLTLIPDLIDNEKFRVADVLRNVLAQSEKPCMDIATAFMNLGGLEAIEPEIYKVERLRLLLGKEQEQKAVVGKRLLEELQKAQARGETSASEIKRWQDFFEKEHVEVRLYSSGFLHGKAYIVKGVQNLGAVGIVGSSNFTLAGLTTNRELNAVLKQSSAVEHLQNWFDRIFQESKDYKPELLEILRKFTREYTPYEIYIKVLYEALKDRISADLGEKEKKPSPIALADFQHDGYLAAKEILDAYDGVLIADSVGLGKTYLALRLLDDLAYKERQTALIICPAAVRDTVWRPLLEQHAIPYKIISMEEVSQRDFDIENHAQDYKVIVVDESHNFRNPETNRWKNLFEVLTKGEAQKKIILLTATPVNNTVWDLFHQLRLITRDDDGFLLVAGIKSLEGYFRKAEANNDVLYEVLEALAVRRSRQFIRKNYPDAKIDGQKIHFPERKIETLKYSLKETYGAELYKKIAETIEGLRLAPYQIEGYRKEFVKAYKRWIGEQWGGEHVSLEEGNGMMESLKEAFGGSKEKAHEFVMALGRQSALAYIMRVLFLKRLESSVEALRKSLQNLYKFFECFLGALDNGRVLDAKTYRRWLQIVGNEDEEAEETEAWEKFIQSLDELEKEHYDIEGLREAVHADLKALVEVLEGLSCEREDSKLQTLKKLLASDGLKGHKIVVFSYFKDTARYIFRHLEKDKALSGRRLDIVDSDVKPDERKKKILRFAPKGNKVENLLPGEDIDILISTDVLSEGQNLQDADVIINYDLHWNPVRMVQRVGRLDRLGSPHPLIHVSNFFPEEELEELLGLVRRLREKIDDINRTVGLDASILGEMPNPMDFNILRRLGKGDSSVMDELEGQSELAVGEFLKQDLLSFVRKMGEEYLRDVPFGVGTVRRHPEGRQGFFGAFRDQKGQHYWVFYDEKENRFVDGRLEAISVIRCEQSEPAMPYPDGFEPTNDIGKLRRYLYNRIREATHGTKAFKNPQRNIISWLRAQKPCVERNSLLMYFEERPLSGLALKELKQIWRNKPQQVDEMLKQLLDFQKKHPHPSTEKPTPETTTPQIEEKDLECIAWVKVC